MKRPIFREDELLELTVVELKKLALKYKIELQSGWRKSQIIDALIAETSVEVNPMYAPPPPEIPQSARVKRIQDRLAKS